MTCSHETGNIRRTTRLFDKQPNCPLISSWESRQESWNSFNDATVSRRVSKLMMPLNRWLGKLWFYVNSERLDKTIVNHYRQRLCKVILNCLQITVGSIIFKPVFYDSCSISNLSRENACIFDQIKLKGLVIFGSNQEKLYIISEDCLVNAKDSLMQLRELHISKNSHQRLPEDFSVGTSGTLN